MFWPDEPWVSAPFLHASAGVAFQLGHQDNGGEVFAKEQPTGTSRVRGVTDESLRNLLLKLYKFSQEWGVRIFHRFSQCNSDYFPCHFGHSWEQCKSIENKICFRVRRERDLQVEIAVLLRVFSIFWQMICVVRLWWVESPRTNSRVLCHPVLTVVFCVADRGRVLCEGGPRARNETVFQVCLPWNDITPQQQPSSCLQRARQASRHRWLERSVSEMLKSGFPTTFFFFFFFFLNM